MNHNLDIDKRVCSVCGVGVNDPDAIWPCPGPHAKVAEAMHAQGRTLQGPCVQDRPTRPIDERLKDSGSRTQFATGAVRDMQLGKGRMDLLPMRALIEVSKLYEAGATKYAPRNWEKGIEIGATISSGCRHAANFMIGNTDEAHLTQAVWNFLCALDTMLRIRDGFYTDEERQAILKGLPFDSMKFMDSLMEFDPE